MCAISLQRFERESALSPSRARCMAGQPAPLLPRVLNVRNSFSLMHIHCRISSAASLGRTDYSRVDMPGLRDKSVNLGAENSPG